MYPIRASRSVWAKSFARPHTCNELCHSNYIISDHMIRISYQTGCLFPEKIEPAYIHLSERNDEERTRFLDEPVPVPRQVQLLIEHPLRHPRMYEHVFEENEVVYLSTIVALFDAHYKRIYAEEEEKATHREYWIVEQCSACDEDTYTEEKLADYLVAALDVTAQCAICFENEGDTPIVQVNHCQHVFHQACLLKWFNTTREDQDTETERKSNTCPMCRQPLILCATCQSTQKIKRRFFGAVPPFNMENEDQEDRPETDGPYGIHSIYYEELFFKGIHYDAQQQLLRLLPLERLDD